CARETSGAALGKNRFNVW
nr:immunoglobulin heavy chain junction region [Macaca mulatta]MOV49582.1 immunoglobulin heavy chain junction region [Macaca mulatta]